MQATAIVTGATGGLGPATVERLLDDGWRVVAPWRSAAGRERLAPHARLSLVEADLMNAEAAEEVAEAATAMAEVPLTGLVNLVGGFDAPGRVDEVPLERFEAQLRSNLRPTYLMTQAAVRRMLQGAPVAGSVVCVGTRAAVAPFPGAAGYIAAKAAVIAFTQAVAAEYRPEGIRANAILPSVIDTPANRAAMPDARHERWVAPAEIAGVIAHLLSPDSVPTSGAAIPVYGRA